MTVRTELVFEVQVWALNRFMLCRLVARATHRLEKVSGRIQITVKDVVTLFGHADPVSEASVFSKVTADLEACSARVLRSVRQAIEHMELGRRAVSHAGLSSEIVRSLEP